jgi:MFS family permease
VYAYRSPPIRYILMLLALVSMMGMPYTVLMPVVARDILHGGPGTLGFLMGATGVGAVSGALMLATRRSVVGLGRWIPMAAAMFGVGLVAFAFSRLIWLSMLLLLLVGFGMMVQMAASNTILQTIAEDDKRGRVMSLYTMSFMGMAPFGSLLAGSLASTAGAPVTLLLSGCLVLIGAGLFTRKLPSIRKILRPLYARQGIIPEVSAGLQAATDVALRPDD